MEIRAGEEFLNADQTDIADGSGYEILDPLKSVRSVLSAFKKMSKIANIIRINLKMDKALLTHAFCKTFVRYRAIFLLAAFVII